MENVQLARSPGFHEGWLWLYPRHAVCHAVRRLKRDFHHLLRLLSALPSRRPAPIPTSPSPTASTRRRAVPLTRIEARRESFQNADFRSFQSFQ
jgi:hypothetical protein